MGDFKDGWNVFSISVAAKSLKWHLSKLTGKSDTDFNDSIAYYMRGDNKNPPHLLEM